MVTLGRKVSVVAGGVALAAAVAYAAVQLKPTKVLVVKNTATRTINWKVVEKASTNTLVGDPTVSGATLNIELTPGGTQCVHLPASGWTPINTIGFKYKDAKLVNGPVKVAQIKKTPKGVFQIKANLKGSGITVVPGNPTASYALNFSINGGDAYCTGSGTATPKPNSAKTFKVSNDTTPATCLLAACSPSGAFLD